MDTVVQLHYYKDIMQEEEQERELNLEQQDLDVLLESSTDLPVIMPENGDEDQVVTSSRPGYFDQAGM